MLYRKGLTIHVDVPTMTLHYSFQSERADEVGHVIPDYMNTLVKNEIVHPDDAEMYVAKTLAWLEDETVEITARFSVVTKDYQWYTVKGKQFFDEDGNLIEIVGALVNVQQEQALKSEFSSLNQYFSAMQKLSDDILFHIDIKTQTMYHSDSNAQSFGVPIEIPNYVDVFIEQGFVRPEDADSYRDYNRKILSGESMSYQIQAAVGIGVYEWFDVKSQFIYDDNGNPCEIFGTMENIHKSIEMQQEFSTQSQYFKVIQELTAETLFHIDVKTKTYHSTTLNLDGTMGEVTIPNYVEYFISSGAVPPEDAEEYRANSHKLITGKLNEFEIRAKDPESGEYHWYEIKGKCINDERGNAIEIFGTLENVQWRKDLEQRATYDVMTKVLNKASFENEVALILSNSPSKKQHALIFIDLDDFKGVNDTLGHSFGDLLLTTVGKRLKRVVRKSDLVGRIGGDEFAVFLQNIDSEEAALLRTNLLLETLRRKFSFEGNEREIKSSMGISVFPQHGSDYKELIEKSDIALYSSKDKGKNVVTLYTPELEEY